MITYSEVLTTFGTTTSQDFATVLGKHSFPETMFIHSLAIGGLICSFHCRIINFVIIRFRSAKLNLFFQTANAYHLFECFFDYFHHF